MFDDSGTTGPMNFGNPDEFTMLELAEQVVEIIGSKSKIVYKPLPPDDPRRRCPDITLAKETLGWKPKIGLREGLTKTVAYFDGLLGSR
jgi:UDP-glucuronate decarboxylase